jgi:hypothetical protein
MSELAELEEWAAKLYGIPAEDALMALDRDLMRAEGMPASAAEQMALQHARNLAVGHQADAAPQLEAGQ